MPAALAEPLDISALAESLRVPLLRVSRRLRQEAQKVGMSAHDAMILGHIKKRPGIGVSELAEADQITRPTMSAHVKRLEASGWVARRDDAQDGRRCGFTVSPAGVRKLEAIRRRRNDWLAAQLASLTPAERDRLAAAAGALMRLVETES